MAPCACLVLILIMFLWNVFNVNSQNVTYQNTIRLILSEKQWTISNLIWIIGGNNDLDLMTDSFIDIIQ